MTISFRYSPGDAYIGDMATSFELVTVPGPVYYNATRKLVLKGADGIVFVADSRSRKLLENIKSLQNLEDNLREMGVWLNPPMVMRYNKRDLPEITSLEVLDARLNRFGAPALEATAKSGKNVRASFDLLVERLLRELNELYHGRQTEASGRRRRRRRRPRSSVGRSRS